MKKLAFILVSLIATSLTSCIVVTDGPPGPNGYSGNAYVGVSYDDYEPYSYWDNNPDVPNNPYFDEYYGTIPGLYEFEYFVNRNDYYYGTYEVWVNPGGAGRPNGIAGRNGADSYLLLICNQNGPYEDRKSKAGDLEMTKLSDGSLEYTVRNADGGMKVTMKKADRRSRTPHEPKAIYQK